MSGVGAALSRATRLLERRGIPYAISGSLAAAYHGYVRATEDVDLQVAIEELSELEDAAEDLGPEVRVVDVRTWRFPGDVDVELYPVEDELDEHAMANRVEGTLPGADEGEDEGEDEGDAPAKADPGRIGWFVPLEALLVLKVREHVRHGHGLRHLADVQQLLARSHDRLDVETLEALLGLDPAWEAAWEEHVEER
jgi:hypothetical protein